MGKELTRRETPRGMKAVPNSLSGPDEEPLIPNSTVMRIIQLPDAENEADRLSSGIAASSPSGVISEMGSRLGANLSGVHFHSDPASRKGAEAMGARAWTQGSDVYFGSGGFEPSVAAHELVHTVQQGAFRGNTGVSVPAGTVQMKPKKEEKKKATTEDFAEGEYQGPIAGDLNGLSQVEAQVMQTLSRGRGLKVYNQIEPDIKGLINNIKAKVQIKYTPRAGVSFLVRAAYQDYAMRDILKELAGKNVGLFKVGTRVRQYKALIQGLKERLGEYQAKELAIQTGMLQGAPKYDPANSKKRKVTKRSYQFDEENGEAASFNPGNVPEVEKIQAEIDSAETLEDAWQAFAKFTGNKNAGVGYMRPEDEGTFSPDMVLVKNKLKHMARMVWDYPELRNTVGDMMVMKTDMKEKMGTMYTNGGRQKSPLFYNVYQDREGEEAEEERRKGDRYREITQDWNGDRDHAGNHELGHILAFNMVEDNSSLKSAKEANNRHETENSILKEVLLNQDVLTPKQKKGIKFFKKKGKYKSSYGNDISYTKGEMDTMHSPVLKDSSITSNYGRNAAFEFFAETFADVYTHGKGAKKASVATVKEYEKRQKKLQADRFKYRQSSGFMRMFRKKV